MDTGKSLSIAPIDQRRLEALIKDRNAPQKRVWRAEIVLFTANGAGTNEIIRRTGESKTSVWRWPERFVEEAFEGLLRDKTRLSRIKPLGAGAAEHISPRRTDYKTSLLQIADSAAASNKCREWRERPANACGQPSIQSLASPEAR